MLNLAGFELIDLIGRPAPFLVGKCTGCARGDGLRMPAVEQDRGLSRSREPRPVLRKPVPAIEFGRPGVNRDLARVERRREQLENRFAPAAIPAIDYEDHAFAMDDLRELELLKALLHVA